MAVLNIENMKVISPSPDNFILKLDLKNGSETTSFNFIASGEHVYQDSDNRINHVLMDKHLAHSSIFDVYNTKITAFSLFDMNDIGITTDDNDVIDNLLLMPNANTQPDSRENELIPMHSINSNAVYGYVATQPSASFGFPGYDDNGTELDKEQKFVMVKHNWNSSSNNAGKTDTLSLYHYRQFATNISTVLGLGMQDDIDSSENGFDKMFVFDPTDDNRLSFNDTNVTKWRGYQSNTDFYRFNVTNNFDNGLLLVRAILFPKQTLNNEYSTERDYVSEDPFNFVRKYEWNEKYFYSNGTNIVLNHKDSRKFVKDSIHSDLEYDKNPGTMVTSTYSDRFGDVQPSAHVQPTPPNSNDKKTDYNDYNTFRSVDSNITSVIGLYNQYSPEMFNRENETLSDTSLKTSKHKANLFDIEFNGLWRKMDENFPSGKDGVNEVKKNLKDSIRANLFKLVDEIKPAHTMLYKISMDDE